MVADCSRIALLLLFGLLLFVFQAEGIDKF